MEKESECPPARAAELFDRWFCLQKPQIWAQPPPSRCKHPAKSSAIKWLKYYKNTSPGSSAGRTYLRRGQFWPSAFRMASVMLEQPEAHKDCNLWHPLHIVMRPSSVICYKKNNNNITSHNDGGGGARHCVFSFSVFQPGTQRPSYAAFNPKMRSNISPEQPKEDKPH